MNAMVGTFIFIILSALRIHSRAWFVLLPDLSQLLIEISNGYSDLFPCKAPAYDNRGNKYNISRILDSNLEFSEELYKTYSPFLLSISFALAYGISFASIIVAAIVHRAL
jgi:hypothetical protein